MAEAGGAFVTRSFKRLLNDAPGRKYNALQTALKAYLERKPELTSASHDEEPAAAARDEIDLGPQQENSLDGNPPPYMPNNEAEIKSVDIVSPVLAPAKPSTCQAAAAAATLAEAGHTLEGSEADLVILPLLLAFESKQSKLIETALDCLHKLISYGHLEGEAGLEGGKNTERVTKILNLVCASVDGTSPDSVVLQVVKVLLSAVASPTFQVHGECLFTAIWTCYTIFLTTKSPVNQATAKATLTQMISIVLRRMEPDKQILRADALLQSNQTTAIREEAEPPASTSNHLVPPKALLNGNTGHQKRTDAVEEGGSILIDTETGEARNASTGETMEMPNSSTPVVEAPLTFLYDLHQLALDADIKGFEAALEKIVSTNGALKSNGRKDSEDLTVVEQDALLVLQTLCKMAMKGGGDEFQNRNKLLSLELLQNCIESAKYAFTSEFRFIDLLRIFVCYILLKACMSPVLPVFQLAANVYMSLLQRFRETLKVELGIFFSLILLRSVDVTETPLPQCSTVLKILEKICNDPPMVADLFINYDCNSDAPNIFKRMVNSLSRLAQGTQFVDPNSTTFLQNTTLNASSLQCLTSILKSIGIWISKHRENGAAVLDASTNKTIVLGTYADADEPEPNDDDKAMLQTDEFGIVKSNEVTLETAVREFNQTPMNGINFLEGHNLIPHDPKSIAWFLKDTPGLDRVMIGDYFGQDDEFSLSVMHAYVDAMSFSDMRFDKALRAILFDIHLPREAEKVDRIIEKFAERYYRDNPRLFKNADTVYVLAYAVIMLNNDIHNSTILPKPSKADFVRMNTSGDDMENAPQELLEEIYDSIVQEEIVYEDAAMRAEKLREQHSLASVLNLCGAQMRDISNAKEESKELVQGSETAVRRGGGSREGVFLQAKCEDFARPMLETVGWPVLAVFSLTMEDSENKSGMVEGLCIEGFRLGIQLAKTLDMDVMRYAFLTSLVRFTFLHAPREMRSKNVEALKMLLGLCQADPDALKDTWNAILECLSRLEYLTSPTHESTNILMLGGNQSSRHSLLLSLTELAGKPMEQVYINSVKLPSDVIVEFFTALCGVSHEELQQNPPRLFSLTKLIEISHYNMLRIRMVWGRIWAVLSSHFVVAGSHAEEKIAVYAINSLQQLMIKCLERPELANFTFQERILKPFVVMMGTSKNPRIRALIVDSIKQMIKSKVGSLKSGWCSVFTVFTIAAEDDVEAISDVAFESVEQVILEDQVLGDCFVDCVTCLLAFANNKISSRSSLKAIALLRICEDRLADGTVIQGTSIQKNTANQTDVEIAEQYWFPMLVGLSDLTSDPRAEVRNCALDVLFDLLKVRGQSFSGPFWESVYDRALSPIFAFVRSVSKRREKPSSQDQWIEEACLHSLQLLCDLFSSFYKEVSFLLPSLLGLLLDCATCPDQTLASIAMGALIRLTEIAGHQFDDKDWTTLLDSLQDVCHSTQPVELLDPTSTTFLGSADSVPGSRKFRGPTTPISNFRGDPTTPTSQDATTTNEGRGIEFLANGTPLRTPPPPPHSVVANGDNASLNNRSVKSDMTSENNQLEQHSVVELEAPPPTVGGLEAIMASPKESRGSPGGGLLKNQASGKSFMGNMIDTLFMRNVTLKGRTSKATEASLDGANQDADGGLHGMNGGEFEGTLPPGVRSKCLIQLLLLGVFDSLQKNHWVRLQPSHKRLIMDTILSMVDFAASYNSDSNLRSRLNLLSGDRPPATLLRQEIEGTRIYLTVLNRTAIQGVSNGGDSKHPNDSDEPIALKGEEQMLREESERCFMAFCGRILTEVATLQPGSFEIIQAEAHQSLMLRSPVTVQVLNAMASMDMPMFKKHLPEFYPSFTKLICSDQMDVRRALGDLFKVQLMALLP